VFDASNLALPILVVAMYDKLIGNQPGSSGQINPERSVNPDAKPPEPPRLLKTHAYLVSDRNLPGPILDLASGDCHNANFLALSGLRVVACDRSEKALDRGSRMAARLGVILKTWQVDLEQEGINPLPEDSYGGIIVFYYLHRPLIPCIRKALKEGGILIYETFTVDQPRFGKPRNPSYLLKPGELRQWFEDWRIIHDFEGIKHNPERAVAQIVCQKGG
jgi:tellurite methyltransferase